MWTLKCIVFFFCNFLLQSQCCWLLPLYCNYHFVVCFFFLKSQLVPFDHLDVVTSEYFLYLLEKNLTYIAVIMSFCNPSHPLLVLVEVFFLKLASWMRGPGGFFFIIIYLFISHSESGIYFSNGSHGMKFWGLFS